MQNRGANVSLKPLDDLFETEESRQKGQAEQVQQIALSELHTFKNHPFDLL